MGIAELIRTLRESDEYIRHIYTQGGCYRFHLLLREMYGTCTPCISGNKDHIITLYKGKYYDILGEVNSVEGFTEMTVDEKDLAETWSFRKQNLLRLSDCPHCEEPLTYDI